jgi:hypothetical protein
MMPYKATLPGPPIVEISRTVELNDNRFKATKDARSTKCCSSEVKEGLIEWRNLQS